PAAPSDYVSDALYPRCRCDAERPSVGGDKPGHRSSVTISVDETAGSLFEGEVHAGDDSSPQIGVFGVDAAVDQRDGDTFTSAVSVRFGNVEVLEMPLCVADGVICRGRGCWRG